MSEKDTVTKKYMSNATVFADIFNFFLYDGKQVISSHSLKELDTAAIALLYNLEGKKEKTVQKYRDVLKYLTGMTDEKNTYLILGIENQSEIHYAMPVRNWLYDALQYTEQVAKISSMHRERKDIKGAEYLSGFSKKDQLIPVITLVVYFGEEEWDAPLSLYEMLMVKDENILSFVPDYKIHLITPQELQEDDFEKFQTNFREVMLFLKYQKDKKEMKKLLNTDDIYRNLDRDAALVLNTCAGINVKLRREEEKVDMCKAWDDMGEECRMEGKKEGRKEEAVNNARMFFSNGASKELVIASIQLLTREEIEKIYEEVQQEKALTV